jgi:hypothetical protein
MSENLNLTVEHKSQLHDAAFAKATRSVEEKDYFNQFGFGGGLDNGDQQPIEEKSKDFVRSILTSNQQKLWNITLERDRTFSMNTQKGMLGGIIEQLKKVQPTSEELRSLAH